MRETKLQAGAELVAQYCKKRGDISGAMEFLLIGNSVKEAFNLATSHDEMDKFEGFLNQVHMDRENGTSSSSGA